MADYINLADVNMKLLYKAI